MTPELKRCSKCLLEKPRWLFGRQRKNPDGLRQWCRACDLVYQQRYRAGVRGVDRLR